MDGDTGDVLDFLTDPDGSHISSVSAVSEGTGPNGERLLFLGNLVGDYVSVLNLDKGTQSVKGSSSDAATHAGHHVEL
jgi:hypothetical protein